MFSSKYAVKTVSRRKKRNMLTILGLAIGVAMIASAQIATDTLIVTFTDISLADIGELDVLIWQKDQTVFNQTVYEQIANDPEVQNEIAPNGISPRLWLWLSVATNPETGQIDRGVSIGGINDTLDASFGQLTDADTGEEVFVRDLAFGEVIIGRSLSDELDAEEGETIVVGFTDNNNQTVNHHVQIAHIVKNSGKAAWSGGDLIFLSLPHFRILYGAESNEINNIILNTKEGEERSDKTVNALETALANAGIEDLFNVIALRDLIKDSIEEGLSEFESVLLIFGSFVIVSGIILIINIFLMNVEERKRSTGVLRAVGMKKGQVVNSFLTEAILLGIIGAFIGILLGMLIGFVLALYVTRMLADVFELEDYSVGVVLEPSVIIVSVIAGIIIAIIAGVYPAIKASKVDIVTTLKGIEKPKRKKAGKRSLILGSLLAAFGLFTLSGGGGMPLLIGSNLAILGVGIAASTYITKTKAWDFIGAALIAIGATLLLTQVEGEGDMFLVLSMFTLITGGIILIGVNLEILTEGLNRFLMRFKKARAVSLFSTKYVGKQKTRSTLTFAIFAIILSMNIGMAIFATSTGEGFDRYAEKVAGGADIIAISQVPMPQGSNTSIQNLDPSIEHAEGFAGAEFGFIYETEELNPDDIYLIPIYAVDHDLEREDSEGEKIFNFEWSEKDEEALDQYETDSPWELLTMNATDDKGRPYAIVQSFEGIGVGESIWLEMEDGTGQEFIVVADPEDPPFGEGVFTSSQIPVIAYASQVRNNEQSIFIIKTTETIDSPKNEEIAKEIETYGNVADNNPENTVYGIEATTSFEIYDEAFSLNTRFINFLNAFIFTGFFVGVIGLLVVAIRSVSERKREIGMMRSIGFRQKTVVRTVLLEVLIVALFGLMLGIINGILIDIAIFNTFLEDFDFIIPWTQLALFIGITLAFSFLAAWYPGRKAAQIPPSEALRYVG